ncbi:MAG TPA: GNAT family N-acetyltransferase [Anaerolineales bacterium]
MNDICTKFALSSRDLEKSTLNYLKFVASLPLIEIYEQQDVMYVAAEAPVFYFNSVFKARFNGNAKQQIDSAKDFFRSRRRSLFTWHITPASQPENLRDLIMSQGGELLESMPYLAVHLDDVPRDFPFPPNFCWKSVRTHEMLAAWISIYCHARGYAESADQLFKVFADLDLTESSPLQLILGYLGDEPIATYSIFMDGEMAGLYSLSTLPEARGHGIGTAISVAAADLATEYNCRTAMLLSEHPSRNICKRLGFVDGFGDMDVYRLPVS